MRFASGSSSTEHYGQEAVKKHHHFHFVDSADGQRKFHSRVVSHILPTQEGNATSSGEFSPQLHPILSLEVKIYGTFVLDSKRGSLFFTCFHFRLEHCFQLL